MKRFTILILVCTALNQSLAAAQSSLWTPLVQAQKAAESAFVTGDLYVVDGIELRQRLSRASLEGRAANNSEIQLPVENGVIQSFKLEESPVMEPALAAKFPQIKSYKVHGIDNPHASGRLSYSPKGFHGMITSPTGTFFINPQGDDVYRAYRKPASSSETFYCGVKGHNHDTPLGHIADRAAPRTPGSLRVYRLALATTGEYAEAIGAADKGDVMSEINKAISRVNQIYERDLAVRLLLINNNDNLIYTNKSTDPYTDPFTDPFNSANDLLEQNEKNVRTVIGSANYDIGHVFSRGGGGLAEVGAVCVDGDNLTGDFKAGGVTGLANPVGDAFYIDYVAHEMGHQFSAEHTFNGTDAGCGGGNRWQSTAFEPGSGSSIMSYAGICGEENISRHAMAAFHAGSIEQITNYTTSGDGSSCGELLSINNPGQPSANAGNDYTIPAQTPFKLTAQGSDPDNGDALTYSWDQMDTGTATNSATFGTDLGNNSLFRSYLPRSINERHFPALGTTLKNKFDDSEVLACQSRNINFRLTVLDGNSGIASDDVRISVDGRSGPFEITSHGFAQTLSSGSNVAISWNVANTNLAPVNCDRVDISLLTFNNLLTTYSETSLDTDVINDGSAFVSIPLKSSSKARFKVQCSNNVFYDISDADLIISGGTAFSTNQKTVFYNQDGASYTIFDTPAEICQVNVSDDSSGGGGGSLNLYWLISLVSFLFIRRKAAIAHY